MGEEKTKKCPKCKSDIPVSASRCAKCQADLRSFFARHKIITAILLLFVFFAILSAIEGDNPSATDKGGMAVVCTQNKVKESLKSPGTAKFPWGMEAIWDNKNNMHLVSSYVDSENSFGGSVRSEFVCEITDIKQEQDTFTCKTSCVIN